jgi:hypothetical protein
MVFKITSTNFTRKADMSGMTLVEMMVAFGLGSLLLAALAVLFYFSNLSFVSFTNYVDLDRFNRFAVDTMTREIREVNKVTGYSVDSVSLITNSLTFEDFDGLALDYTYSPGARRLTRTKSGSSSVLLTNCDYLAFWLGQRTPTNGTYNVFPAADATTAKLVDVSWRCSTSMFSRETNTENVVTARVVIRKQGK